jgi:hypothetical protein
VLPAQIGLGDALADIAGALFTVTAVVATVVLPQELIADSV